MTALGPAPSARCAQTSARRSGGAQTPSAGCPGAALGRDVPALVAQVGRNRRVAIKALIGARDRLFLGAAVVHGKGVDVAADKALVRGDRRRTALEQA